MNILSAIIGYLIGSINTSLVVGFAMGVDIRKQGSGNAGATNALRVLGKKVGVIVFLGDFLKGILACLVGWLIFKNHLISGIFAILGHVFPVYYNFKGGKGVSTVLGVLLFFDWKIFLICSAWMIIMIYLTKIVSISTLSGLIIATVLGFVLHNGELISYAILMLTVVIFITHRANIKRLLNGTENKFGKKKDE